MLVHCRVLLVAFLLLATALPVSAAERVDTLPPTKPVHKARFDLALLINGQQFVVGKGAIASPTRAYFALRTLPLQGAPEQTLEVVTYDGIVYVREGSSTQFVVVSNEETIPFSPPPPNFAEEIASLGTTSRIGTVTIGGVPTDHYQVWINSLGDEAGANTSDNAMLSYAKLDTFIGQQVNNLYQLQFSLYGIESGAEVSFESVARFYDFDDPSIVVGQPTNAVSQAMPATGLAYRLRTGGVLQIMSTPLSTPQLRALVRGHQAR